MNYNEMMGRGWLHRAVAVTGLLAFAAACNDEPTPAGLIEGQIVADAPTSFEVSDLSAAPGEEITLGVKVTIPGAALGGVQGQLSWDASKLALVGQVPEDGNIVIVNASDDELDLVAVNGQGIEGRAATFAFEVLGAGWASSLRFEPEVVVDVNEQQYDGMPGTYVGAASMPAAADARILTVEDWAAQVAAPATGALRAPGESDVYGDADQNNTVNVLDVLYTANISVGNTAVAECIIGTSAPDRDCVAANVRPINGGVGASPAPGVETDGSRVVNVLDVLAVALESVCTTQPCRDGIAVVGEGVPNAGGGQDRPDSHWQDTVVIAAPDTIFGNRVFDADTLYQIVGGFLYVGDEAGASGTITFEPGARIEGDTLSAILVSRNGQIFANGTAEAPVTFTCVADGVGARSPGCWGGVFIAGNAIINDEAAGLGPAPTIAGRNPSGGGKQKVGEGGALNYGGSNDADNSGSIRYSRFLYGGAELAPNNELNNLSIGACGSGTVLEYIQVHAGLDDGLELFGGRCDVKGLYATANDDDNFDYSFGYDGDVQFVIVQQRETGDKGFEVDNTEDLATFDNQPRTGPRVYNVTMVGATEAQADGGAKTALRIRRGAGGELRNFLIVKYDDGFDPEETATCELLPNVAGTEYTGTLPNILTLDNVVFLTVDDAADSGSEFSAGCEPAAEAYLNTVATNVAGGFELTNGEQGRAYSGELKAPFAFDLPDFRPVGSGVTSTVAAPTAVPAGFEPATYFGAVRPVGAGGSIPWYAGWTVGWQSSSAR